MQSFTCRRSTSGSCFPRVVGRGRRRVKKGQRPHEAIDTICRTRNALVHVRFAQLSKELPDALAMTNLFKDFIHAMEDMNVALGRTKKARKSVLRLASV